MRQKRGIWLNESTFKEFTDKAYSLTEEFATRGRSIDFSVIGGILPNPDPVLKKAGKSIRVYRELSYESQVSTCFLSRRAGVLKLNWKIDQCKAENNVFKFVEDTFKKLDIFKITQEMLEATQYGFQPMEVMWKNAGGMLAPSDIVAKPADWFVFDDENNLRMRTVTSILGELLPEKKFLCPAYNASYANPYGEACLSKVYWPVVFKKNGLKFWVTFAEKYGIPFLMATYQPGTSNEKIQEIADMLENMVQDAIAVVPEGTNIAPIDVSGSNKGEIYDNLVRVCNAEISKVILGQTLSTELGEGGSLAATQGHLEVRSDIIITDKKMTEGTYNQAIDWSVDLNFGEGKEKPRFILYANEDVDKELADRDDVLYRQGVRFTKKYYQNNYSLEEDDFEMQEQQLQQQQPFYNNPFAFAESKALQDIQENLPADELQKMAEVMLKPVFELINKSSSYEEIMEGLVRLYPRMKTDDLMTLLENAMFASQMNGRFSDITRV